ncbi:MAG TPA: hypothetical protein VFC92_10395 [Bacteroidales bacterium]|nr:hypothetical protein [Bacteroidales bacterium]
MSKQDAPRDYRRLKRSIAYLLAAAVAVVILYASTMAFMAVRETSRRLTEEFNADVVQPEYLQTHNDTAYWQRLAYNALLRSRASMMAADSASLTIDLVQKTIALELHGVVVHKADIGKSETSRLFSQTDPVYWIRMFSEPHVSDSSVSSVSKQTFLIKNAPRDTTENNALALALPDTSMNQPIFFTLYLTNGIAINVYQQEKASGFALQKYDFARRNAVLSNFIRSISRLEVPDYTPAIDIYIPARDARTLYKALPLEPFITLRLV